MRTQPEFVWVDLQCDLVKILLSMSAFVFLCAVLSGDRTAYYTALMEKFGLYFQVNAVICVAIRIMSTVSMKKRIINFLSNGMVYPKEIFETLYSVLEKFFSLMKPFMPERFTLFCTNVHMSVSNMCTNASNFFTNLNPTNRRLWKSAWNSLNILE